jgi:hypothetical protein
MTTDKLSSGSSGRRFHELFATDAERTLHYFYREYLYQIVTYIKYNAKYQTLILMIILNKILSPGFTVMPRSSIFQYFG